MVHSKLESWVIVKQKSRSRSISKLRYTHIHTILRMINYITKQYMSFKKLTRSVFILRAIKVRGKGELV